MRDVICGHLDADLVGLADELLLADRPVEPEPERYEPFAGRAPLSAQNAEPAASEPELLSDAAEAEEILDLLI